MIPLWLKIIWNGLGFFILLYLPFPISGLIVLSLERMQGGDFSEETKKELRDMKLTMQFSDGYLCRYLESKLFEIDYEND